MGRQKKKIGEKRPSNSHILRYKKSKEKEAIKIYQETGRKAQEWQKLMLKDIMAQNSDKKWTHTRFGYSIPRRNGKNEVVAIRELWGLYNNEKILHTAHRTTASHSAWERLLKLLSEAEIKYKALRASGRENIKLIETEGEIEFRTRSSKGGLGEGFDLLVVDEAQEYTDDQESALKYVVSDSKNPQTIMCGTPPTPISAGTVFTKFRRATLDGDVVNAGWAEWSIEEQSDVRDKELWYRANPSLGTILTERAIMDEVGSDEIDFNIQRLGLWIKYNQKSAISKVEWEELRCEILPGLKGKLFVGIKYGYDNTNVALSIAVKTEDDKAFIECIDCRSRRIGNDWILQFLKSIEVAEIVIDGASGQKLLADEIRAEKLKIPILPTVKEIINANNMFELALTAQSMKHMGQPSLVECVSNCEKRQIGSNGGFGYRSLREDIDIAMLDSVILAHWALKEAKEQKPQRIGY